MSRTEKIGIVCFVIGMYFMPQSQLFALFAIYGGLLFIFASGKKDS